MKAQIVSFHCVLKDQLGRVISSSFNRDVLTQVLEAPTNPNLRFPAEVGLSHGTELSNEPLRGLVEGLQNLKKGEKRHILVKADRAYGFYDPELVLQVPRKRLPEGARLDVGFQVITQADDGECKIFRVIETQGESVTLDGNHPLAGQDLYFDVEAVAAREATDEEIARSQVHGRNSSLH